MLYLNCSKSLSNRSPYTLKLFGSHKLADTIIFFYSAYNQKLFKSPLDSNSAFVNLPNLYIPQHFKGSYFCESNKHSVLW